jgi:hypothetical protein
MSFCDEHGTPGCSDCADQSWQKEVKKLEAENAELKANDGILAGKLAHVNKVLREALLLSRPDRNRQAVENLEIYTRDYKEATK